MIILSKPAKMKKVIVASPLEYSEKTIEVLQEAGVVDVSRVEEKKLISEYETLQRLREEINALITRVKNINVTVELTAYELANLKIDNIKKDVASIYAKIHQMNTELKSLMELEEELAKFNEIILKLPRETPTRNLYYRGRRVSSILVSCRKDVVELITKPELVKSHTSYIINEESIAIIALVETSKLDEFINNARNINAWIPSGKIIEYIEKTSSLSELWEVVSRELEIVREKIHELETSINSVIKDNIVILGKYLLYIDNQLQKYTVIGKLKNLKHITVLTGWIPEEKISSLTRLLSGIDIPVYYELRDPEPGDEPPTLMKNAPVLKFYQVITRLYGVPRYYEWDPTPLLAYSFALFFALMNADFGYALAGILAAYLLLDKLVVDKESHVYKEFKGTLIVSNIIALVLGLLTGTVFGNLLDILGVNPPVLITSLTSPLEFIKLSLIIGLIHVNIAHVLATIKSIKEGNVGGLLIEVGLFISQIFGIPYLLKAFFNYNIPVIGSLPMNTLLYATLTGVVLIIIGSLKTMRFLGLLMWIFQITGVLGDVMSYVRLAGVGLATYYMAMIFNYTITSLISYLSTYHIVLGLIVGIPIAFIAHLLVFVLAELGAFIHSLRLCMLEFLTKFYEGNGYEYNPFRVVSKTVISTST